MRSDDWEKALNEVLDAEAVPTKPLHEFVAACMVERPGRWSALVEWLSAPRRAVAATVAGSFALTALLLMTTWYASSVLPSKAGRPTFPMLSDRYDLARLPVDFAGERYSDDGT